MLSLFTAEWLKVSGNRRPTLFLIWSFPIGVAIGCTLLILIALFSADVRADIASDFTTTWQDTMLFPWVIPNNDLGRLLLLTFTAIIFAGEYQWGTWKNLTTRRRRPTLILIKFITLGAFVVTAFTVMSLVMTFGVWLLTVISGADFGPPLTAEVLTEFGRTYLVSAGLAFVSTLIAAGYAAVAAMITRSIMGAMVVGLILTALEQATLILFALLYNLFDINLFQIYVSLPAYNVTNAQNLLLDSPGYQLRVAQDVTLGPLPLATSLIILTVWVVSLVALTMLWFQRQDIAS